MLDRSRYLAERSSAALNIMGWVVVGLGSNLMVWMQSHDSQDHTLISCTRYVSSNVITVTLASYTRLKFRSYRVVVGASDGKLPELDVRVGVAVVVQEKQGGHGFAVVWPPVVKTPWRLFGSQHVHLWNSKI